MVGVTHPGVGKYSYDAVFLGLGLVILDGYIKVSNPEGKDLENVGPSQFLFVIFLCFMY